MREPKDIWNFLEQKCNPLGAVKEYTAIVKWWEMSFNGKDIQAFCDEFRATIHICRQLDIQPKERLIIYRFIHLITPYFEAFSRNLRTIMSDHLGDDLPLTLDQVISRTIQERNQISDTALHSSTKKLREYKGKQSRDSKFSKDDKPRQNICSHCDFSGHTPKQCFHLHPDKAPDNWEPKNGCLKKHCRFNDDAKLSKKNRHNREADEPSMALHANSIAVSTNNSCVVDSGSSSHMCNDLSAMDNVTPMTRSVSFGEGSGTAKGIGSVTLRVKAPNEHGFINLTFSDVLYLPELSTNLISTQRLQPKGVYYSSWLEAIHTADGTIVGETFIQHGLPHLRLANDNSNEPTTALSSRELSTSTADISLWHKRFGHASLETLSSNNLTGLALTNDVEEMAPCHDCREATSKGS